MQQSKLESTFFTNFHGPVTLLHAWEFEIWHDSSPGALALIKQCFAERHDDRVSNEQICGSALARYFRLLNIGRTELRDVLSDDELLLLHHARPQAVWSGEFETTPADILYSSYGENDLVDEDSAVYQLCIKLAALSPLQQIALIDLMECAWRDRTVGPVRYASEVIGGGDRPQTASVGGVQ